MLSHFGGARTPFSRALWRWGASPHSEATGNIHVDPRTTLGEELLEAVASEPFPRGSPILQGVYDGTRRKLGKNEEPNAVESLPNLGIPDEVNSWQRRKMMDAAAEMVATGLVDLSTMTLQEWQVASGSWRLMSGPHEGGAKIPHYVLKLRALWRGAREGHGSGGELKFHICSKDMQHVAAAYGMPPSGNYRAGDMEERNPTVIVAGSRFALDEKEGESALRIAGIGIDALAIFPEEQREQLGALMEQMMGGLVFKAALEQLPPSGLSVIAAARALRWLSRQGYRDQAGQRTHIFGAVEAVIRELKQPFVIARYSGDELVDRREASILAAYTDEWNRKRGTLSGEQMSEVDAEESLRIVVQGILCTVENGQPTVRAQRDAVRLTHALVRKGVSSEDCNQFQLFNKPDVEVMVETIYNKTLPPGAEPPFTLAEQSEK